MKKILSRCNNKSKQFITRDAFIRLAVLQCKFRNENSSSTQLTSQIQCIKTWNIQPQKISSFVRKVTLFTNRLKRSKQLVQCLEEILKLIPQIHPTQHITLIHLILKHKEYIQVRQVQNYLIQALNVMKKQIICYGQIGFQFCIQFCAITQNCDDFRLVLERAVNILQNWVNQRFFNCSKQNIQIQDVLTTKEKFLLFKLLNLYRIGSLKCITEQQCKYYSSQIGNILQILDRYGLTNKLKQIKNYLQSPTFISKLQRLSTKKQKSKLIRYQPNPNITPIMFPKTHKQFRKLKKFHKNKRIICKIKNKQCMVQKQRQQPYPHSTTIPTNKLGIHNQVISYTIPLQYQQQYHEQQDIKIQVIQPQYTYNQPQIQSQFQQQYCQIQHNQYLYQQITNNYILGIYEQLTHIIISQSQLQLQQPQQTNIIHNIHNIIHNIDNIGKQTISTNVSQIQIQNIIYSNLQLLYSNTLPQIQLQLQQQQQQQQQQYQQSHQPLQQQQMLSQQQQMKLQLQMQWQNQYQQQQQQQQYQLSQIQLQQHHQTQSITTTTSNNNTNTNEQPIIVCLIEQQLQYQYNIIIHTQTMMTNNNPICTILNKYIPYYNICIYTDNKYLHIYYYLQYTHNQVIAIYIVSQHNHMVTQPTIRQIQECIQNKCYFIIPFCILQALSVIRQQISQTNHYYIPQYHQQYTYNTTINHIGLVVYGVWVKIQTNYMKITYNTYDNPITIQYTLYQICYQNHTYDLLIAITTNNNNSMINNGCRMDRRYSEYGMNMYMDNIRQDILVGYIKINSIQQQLMYTIHKNIQQIIGYSTQIHHTQIIIKQNLHINDILPLLL